MSVKDDSEKIKRFALMPVSRPPNSGDGRQMNIIFLEQHLQPKPVMLGGGKEVVINFESRLFFDSAIHATKIGQKVKARLRPDLKLTADVGNVESRNGRGHFAERLDDLTDPIRMCTLQRRH